MQKNNANYSKCAPRVHLLSFLGRGIETKVLNNKLKLLQKSLLTHINFTCLEVTKQKIIKKKKKKASLGGSCDFACPADRSLLSSSVEELAKSVEVFTAPAGRKQVDG